MSSDYVVIDMLVGHPPVKVWQLIGHPETYQRFFRGISSCERSGPTVPGQRARYRFTASTADGLVEYHMQALIQRESEKLVLIGDPDIGSWISITLADGGPGRTRLKVVFFKPVIGSVAGHDWTKADVRDWARDGLRRILNYLARVPTSLVTNRGESGTFGMNVVRTLHSSGMLSPKRPDRGIKQLKALATWGLNLVGGYVQSAVRSPHEAGLIDLYGTTTFAQINDRTSQLAAGLERLGVSPTSTVGVLARNHAALVCYLVACGKLGANVVLINTALAAKQVVDTVIDHRVAMLVHDAEFAPLLEHVPTRVRRVSTAPRAAESGGVGMTDVLDAADPERVARPARPGKLIVMTSGTSGAPKGAQRPAPKGFGTIAAMLSRIPLRVGERMLIAAPIFHSWGLAALQISTPLRATVVLRERFDAEDCLRAIAEHRCTSLFAIPIMLRRILDLPVEVRRRYDVSSLRIVASSGSAMSGALVTEFMDTFGDVLYNFYGSTEVSWGTVAGPDDLRAAPTTAGRPPLGTALAVLDTEGEILPVGATGRIFIGNEMLFDGYTDGGSRDVRGALMDTGDLGYVDANGRLFVSGRQDEMIISGGENVFPRPVEEALSCLPQVADVAVVGVPDAEFGQRLAAYLVLREGARLDASMVRAYVRHRLPKFAVPRDVTFLDELPRNPTGKILKRLLVDAEWLSGTDRHTRRNTKRTDSTYS